MRDVSLYLSAGEHPRSLTLRLREDQTLSSGYIPRGERAEDVYLDVLLRYLAGVSAGCLGPEGKAGVGGGESRGDGLIMQHVSKLVLPSLPLAALAPLCELTRDFVGSFRGVVGVSIDEDLQDGVAHPVHMEPEEMGILPAPSPLFELLLPSASEEELSEGCVVVSFESAVADATFVRVRAVFDAWEGLCKGGFRCMDGGRSGGEIEGLEVRSSRELVVVLKSFRASRAGFDALVRGLDVVSRKMQGIERVAIGRGASCAGAEGG